MEESSQPAPPPRSGLPGARAALMLLLAINLFNYIDRQVLAAVEPEVREEFLKPDNPHAQFWLNLEVPLVGKLDEPKFWTGCLSMAFLVFYMLMAPVFGLLADRTSRWLLVAIGVTVWSLASGGSGLAATFLMILLTRCLVGIGEAVYGPVAPSMISDLYPVRVRGSVLAWFYAAIPVGSALGYVLGSVVKASPLGWRWAFFLVVVPGLLLGVLCLFMREPPRGLADAVIEKPKKKPGWREYRVLFQTPSYILCTLGMTAMTFALGGIAWWMPAYLEEYRKVPSVFGAVEPVTLFGGIVVLTGLTATLLGGLAGDRLRPRYPGSYFLVSGIAMLLAVPVIFLFLHTPFPWAWLFLTLCTFFLFFNTGPTNTILANVTHPSIRASAFALNILIIHLFGDALSPPLLGWIIGRKDRYELAFGLVSALVFVGGLLWIWGTRYLATDTARAPTRL